MKKNMTHSVDIKGLRQRAKEFLNKNSKSVSEMSAKDIQNLVEEFHIYQIELEMQNEELSRAQLNLKESRDRYSDLYDFAPTGYVTINKKGMITEANMAFASMLGVERRTLANKPFSSFITRDTQDVFYLHRRKIMETKNRQTCDLKFKRSNGSFFHAQLECIVKFDEDQTSRQVRFAIIDITKRKKDDEQQKLFIQILSLLNKTVERTDIIREILTCIKESLGIEAIGIRLQEGDDYPYYHTNGFPAAFVEAEKYLCSRDNTGEIIRDIKRTPVLECMCGNVICGRTNPLLPFFTEGGSFWTNSITELPASTTEEQGQSCIRNRCSKKYESVALVPLRSNDKIIGLLQLNDKRKGLFTRETIMFFEGIGASIGIALVRNLEKETLRESEEKYRSLVDNIKVGVALISPDMEVLSINRQLREWYPSIDETKRNICYHVFNDPPRDEPCSYCDTQLTLEDGLVHESITETPFGGSVKNYRIISSPIRDKVGNIVNVIKMAEDITETVSAEKEKKYLQSQLYQTQKLEAIGILAGGIAHDFNNILWTIIGCTELAQSEVSPESQAFRNLEYVLQAGKRAKELIKQILAFSRSQSGLEKKSLRLDIVLMEVIPMLKSTLPSTIEIQQNTEKNLGLVFADPTQIHQIVMNLCTNAARAMQNNGGILKISLSNIDINTEDMKSYPDISPGPYVNLTVSDTGHGMNNDVMERIFDPFFTTETKGRGTGLGLSVVHGIVKGHKGDIRVKSAPGEGTTFQVLLPRIEGVEEAQINIDKNIVPASGKESILFVDDEPALVYMAKKILEHLGYEVVAMVDSTEALATFKASPHLFDLVITDYTMPKMTGMELAGKLVAIRPDIPVILCSGLGEGFGNKELETAGVRKLVSKPVPRKVLARIIREILDQPKMEEG